MRSRLIWIVAALCMLAAMSVLWSPRAPRPAPATLIASAPGPSAVEEGDDPTLGVQVSSPSPAPAVVQKAELKASGRSKGIRSSVHSNLADRTRTVVALGRRSPDRTQKPPAPSSGTPAGHAADQPASPGFSAQPDGSGALSAANSESTSSHERSTPTAATSPGPLVLPAPSTTHRPVLTPPALLNLTPPEYPGEGYQVTISRSSLTSELQVKAAEGRVVLRLLVRVDGRVDHVDVGVSSGYDALDRTAIEAARTWRFAPATRDGQPIEAWVVIPVRFIVP